MRTCWYHLYPKKYRKPNQPNNGKLSILEKLWLFKGPLKCDQKRSYILQNEISNILQAHELKGGSSEPLKGGNLKLEALGH